MRHESPIPQPVHSRWGHQVPDHQEAFEKFDKAADQAFAATNSKSRKAAKIYGVEIVIGSLSHTLALPRFAAALPIAKRDEILANRKAGAAGRVQLKWGDVCRLQASTDGVYTSGQFWRREAAEQVWDEYDRLYKPEPILPK